jgi:hypothetical protein
MRCDPSTHTSTDPVHLISKACKARGGMPHTWYTEMKLCEGSCPPMAMKIITTWYTPRTLFTYNNHNMLIINDSPSLLLETSAPVSGRRLLHPPPPTPVNTIARSNLRITTLVFIAINHGMASRVFPYGGPHTVKFSKESAASSCMILHRCRCH